MSDAKKAKLPNGILSILDLRRPYVHSSSVDVQSTWQRFGWEPSNRATQGSSGRVPSKKGGKR